VKRKVFTAAALLSLLLCMAIVVLWVRSRWVGDLLYWDTVDENGVPAIYGIESAATPIGSRFGYVYIASFPPMKASFTIGRSIHLLIGHSALGRGALPRYGWQVGDFPLIPHWSISLMFAVLPAVWLLLWVKARRLPKAGQCRTCRYDLTGNSSGVCPECGMAIAGKVGM
jgi:hypothetical protein